MKKQFKLLTMMAILLNTSVSFSAVPNSTWNAVVDKQIIIQFNDTLEITAKVIACQDSAVTVVKADGSIESIQTNTVNSIRMVLEQNNKEKLLVSLDRSFKKKRTYGPMIGFGPAIVGFNADIDNINLFASGSFLLPILTSGDNFTFTIGAGRLIKIGSVGWKFNFFSHISLFTEYDYDYNYDAYNYAATKKSRVINIPVGAGIGMQYITQNGILFSFKVPIVGFSFSSRGIDELGAALYYPHSAASMPSIMFGKSF